MLDKAIDIWTNRESSKFQIHDAACCRAAIEWIQAMDSSMRHPGTLSGPSWIRELYDWGPQSWPVHWCEAIERQKLDCGGLAVVATAAMQRSNNAIFPAQTIQSFSQHDVEHWGATFSQHGADTSWLYNEYVYHEAVAIFDTTGNVNVWDPTDCSWLRPESPVGYGSTIAIRVETAPDVKSINWHGTPIVPNCWTALP